METSQSRYLLPQHSTHVPLFALFFTVRNVFNESPSVLLFGSFERAEASPSPPLPSRFFSLPSAIVETPAGHLLKKRSRSLISHTSTINKAAERRIRNSGRKRWKSRKGRSMRMLEGEGNSGNVKHRHRFLASKYSRLRVHPRALVIQLRSSVIVTYSEDSIPESCSRVPRDVLAAQRVVDESRLRFPFSKRAKNGDDRSEHERISDLLRVRRQRRRLLSRTASQNGTANVGMLFHLIRRLFRRNRRRARKIRGTHECPEFIRGSVSLG